METQLEMIAKSYDQGIELGRKGINMYDDLPAHIKNDPDFPLFQKCEMEGVPVSGRKEIRDYLSPRTDMKFIDLGCCLNLMFRGYDSWLSTYHGVDISGKTIQLLQEFSTKNHLPVGALYCGSIHETPFDSNYFDIGTCIGVLEYFDKAFAARAIMEAHRIMKPFGRFVLEIPDIGHPMCRMMMLVEEHLGRPEKFDMSPQAFEDMLQNYFEIEKTEKGDARPMIQYFLRCKK